MTGRTEDAKAELKESEQKLKRAKAESKEAKKELMQAEQKLMEIKQVDPGPRLCTSPIRESAIQLPPQHVYHQQRHPKLPQQIRSTRCTKCTQVEALLG